MQTARPTMIRQGDVLLVARPSPRNTSPALDADGRQLTGLRVPGERTGHAHVLPATVYDAEDGTRMLHLDRPGHMTHEEHAAVEVPPGWWEVRIQREYVPSSPITRGRFD